MAVTMSQDTSEAVAGRTYGGMSAEERARSRRQRLIDAAQAVISEHGVAALTVEQVCQTAELIKRYFYADFSGKDDLLDVCAEQLFTRLWNAMDGAVAAASEPERVRAAAQAVVHTLASDPASARLYAECAAFPRLRERQQRAIREFSERMAADVIPFTGDPPGGIRRDLAARIIIAGSTDLIVDWLQGTVETDEQTVIATIAAAALGAAAKA
jgi:AcrR family transcriptional regulator